MLDLGSTNGLLVNSRRIVRRALQHRDLIQIGPARVMYLNELAVPQRSARSRRNHLFRASGISSPRGEDDARHACSRSAASTPTQASR